MKDGFYKRTEYKMVVYEFDGKPSNLIAMITADFSPEDTIILTDKRAEELMMDLAKHIEGFDEDEEG